MPQTDGWARSSDDPQAFVHDLDALDRHVVALCVQGGAFVFADPALFEVPFDDALSQLVAEHNAAVAAIGDPVDDVEPPQPERPAGRKSAFEHDVVVLA